MESIARRDFLGGVVGLMAAAAAGGCTTMAGSTMSSPTASVPKLAYVGCYTSKERNGHGEGINVYQIDAATGNWTHVQLLKGVVNPSFLTFDRQKRTLYAAVNYPGTVAHIAARSSYSTGCSDSSIK